MTLTTGRKRAAQQLRYGYFSETSERSWVTCPECRERVHASHVAWSKPSERVATLREQLAQHLADEH